MPQILKSPMESGLPVVGPAEHPGKSMRLKVGGVAPASENEAALLSWVRAGLSEGHALVASEDVEEDVDENMAIVMGDYSGPDNAGKLGNTRAKHVLARIGKNVEDLAASLTDFKPTGSYRTYNTMFEGQAQILDKLLTHWWVTQDIDLKLSLGVKQSLVARTAYLQVVFNPQLHGGLGDIDMVVRDYRDVIPIRPNGTITIQDAVGVIAKSKNTVNWGRARYPEHANDIVANFAPSSMFSKKGHARRKVTTMEVLTGSSDSSTTMTVPTYDHYEVYVRDPSINGGRDRVWIGPGPKGDNAWGYWVEPKEPLYPRGRLIVIANLTTVLFDGGNPYWHGMFPFIKLTLSPWPWSNLGKSALIDAKSAQFTAIELTRSVTDQARKALNPGIIASANAVSRQLLENLDTSEPGWKLHAGAFGAQGIELEKPLEIPAYVREERIELEQGIDHVMGILDMRSLSQLRMNTLQDVETLLEAVGPSVRARGRVLEVVIRELGEMMKSNFMQFYSKKRRIQILGPEGLDIEDFKYDPESLVPAFTETDIRDGEFDDTESQVDRFFERRDGKRVLKPRSQRAQQHAKSFTYYITPNSLLELAKTQQKLIYLQFFRMGIMDPITLLEKFNVPNIAQILERMQQAETAGFTGVVSAAGRKSSGDKSPRMVMKES
jgi:hypothetical protein